MANRGGHVVGVLLAAGRGTRFEDGSKLLASVEAASEAGATGPELMVRLATRRLVDSPVGTATAVLGHEATAVERALEGLEIETVRNPDYESGQSSSVAVGVEWARERDADAVLFALGDMPWVEPETYRRIVDRWQETEASIVAPEHDGQRGNPVLFGAVHFDALAAVSGDIGGRELIEQHPVEWVAVDGPGIHRDVDRVADLEDTASE